MLINKILNHSHFGFIKDIFFSTLTHSVGLLISFVGSVLLTRKLGLDGRGVLSWIMYFNILGMSLAPLGMGQTSRRFIAEEPKRASDLTLISIIACSLFSLILIPIFIFIGFSNDIGTSYKATFIVSVIAIPFGAISNIFGEILVGLNDGKNYNKNIIIQKIVNFVLIISIIFLGIATPLYAIIALAFSLFIKFTHSLYFVSKKIYFKFNDPKWVLKHLSGYTFYGYISFVSVYLMRLIIPILMGFYSTRTEVGLYASAIVIIEAMFIFPQMVSMYLIPKIAQTKHLETQRKIIFYSVVVTAGIIAIGSLFFFLISKWLILLLYGTPFLDVVPVFKILLIGAVFFSIATVLQSVILARLKSFVIVIPPVLSLVVATFISPYLVKSYGAIGGSWVFVISLFVFFLSTLFCTVETTKK
jgi:O-antigen/teichoic acid export membrane protein